MNGLNVLEIKYSKDYRDVFEDLATLLFCTDLDLSRGVNRRINQKGIESDPVRIGDKVYAYQAKYYDASTKLNDRKEEIINSIQVARDKGVTNLYLFINKNKPDRDPKTNEEVSYIKEIEDAARGESGQKPIQLEWWTKSKIENALTIEGKFDYIRNIYFKDDAKSEISRFYEYANELLAEKPRNNGYDTMSLQDSYIELYLEEKQSVRGFLEEFVEEKKEYIAVISGELGHGKTSLCYKAMTDFRKNDWLAGKVSNVFCFSLNPAGLPVSVYSDWIFTLSPLLSWGGDRGNDKLKYENCNDALIFFDGFDELLEKYPNLIYSNFFGSIKDFQRQTNSHVIITSRNIAVVDSDECNKVLDKLGIHTHSLQYITKSNQERWISLLKENLEKKDTKSASEVAEYLDFYQQMDVEDDIKSLLGIPRIFRMVVDELIRLQKGQPVIDFYERLFDVNWDSRKKSAPYTEEDIKGKLQEYALSIFLSDSKRLKLILRIMIQGYFITI